jgi:hypothetical protein
MRGLAVGVVGVGFGLGVMAYRGRVSSLGFGDGDCIGSRDAVKVA